MTGEDFFRASAEEPEKRSRSLAQKPQATVLEWESQSVSPDSPGPVEHRERLLRALDQPNHWDRVNRRFTPRAFDEAGSHGLSVYRVAHCLLDEIVRHAQERLVDKFGKQNGKPEPRQLVGFAGFDCAQLRAVMGQSPEPPRELERLMVVFDTSTQVGAAGRAHADVLVRAAHGQLRKRAISLLFDFANANLRTCADEQATPNQIGISIEELQDNSAKETLI